jgi:hypothetical protein
MARARRARQAAAPPVPRPGDRLRWSFDALIAGIAAVPTPPAEIAASNT